MRIHCFHRRSTHPQRAHLVRGQTVDNDLQSERDTFPSGGSVQDLLPEVAVREIQNASSPVSSYNEWDPLEEIIVGRLDNATMPANEISVTYKFPPAKKALYRLVAGRRYPQFLVKPAEKQLAGLVRLLEAEGVRVRRPDIVDFSRTFQTPFWKSTGLAAACPRDSLLVLGTEIIETPMAWRCRYQETQAYRSLLSEYAAAGAKWTTAPKPQLRDTLYRHDWHEASGNGVPNYLINESEPVFDAADFVRCGQDLFVQKSNVTNEAGIAWLDAHLAGRFRIHRVETSCPYPMHIDSTFMPLAPGKLLVNPVWMERKKIPEVFKSWDILVGPQPDPPPGRALAWLRRVSMVSQWINLNVLMLDERRVIVEQTQTTMVRALKDWGFEPIPCPFMYYTPFGGSFHCATLDVRRRGSLQSYF